MVRDQIRETVAKDPSRPRDPIDGLDSSEERSKRTFMGFSAFAFDTPPTETGGSFETLHLLEPIRAWRFELSKFLSFDSLEVGNFGTLNL